MRNIVTMHQPNYLPWIGLFSKIAQADCFVIMDTFQYTKDGLIHRNKIRTNTGSGYLTIPIRKEFSRAIIKDVELPADRGWQEVHWQTIYRNYIKTAFFKEYSDYFEKLYQTKYRYLWQINIDILRFLLVSFHINVEILTASELNLAIGLKNTDMIIEVLKKIGSKTYLSGPSGKNYLDINKFHENGLHCQFSHFEHPIYRQRYPGFEPNLSAIDLLFNIGPQSLDLIKTSGSIQE